MFVYNFVLKSYQLLLKAASPFHTKAAKMLEGRENIFATITQTYQKQATKSTAWFHCASLGEFEQSRTLIEAFKKNFPNHSIVLTFFSPSGYEIRKNYDQADCVYYLPFDSEKNAKQWFEIIQPNVIFFVKYEFWYYYLTEAKQRNIPTISFSAIFRKEQLFFKSYGSFYREILRSFSHLFVQNQSSVELLQSIDIQNVTLAGDTRFDRVYEIAQQAKTFPLIEIFKQDTFCFVVGSAWADDMAVIAPFLNQFQQKIKVIIAPHEISAKNIAALHQNLPYKKVINYTEIQSQIDISKPSDISQSIKASLQEADIFVIDTIGMLSSLYRYADIAFIGGAYQDGLHNILEAAVFSVPVFFGNKKYKKFQEAVDLLALGGATKIANSQELLNNFQNLYNHSTERKKQGNICYEYVLKNRGGTNKIMNYLLKR
jgi:3-deoxy-D-manno-octulosonic-acid transferase